MSRPAVPAGRWPVAPSGGERTGRARSISAGALPASVSRHSRRRRGRLLGLAFALSAASAASAQERALERWRPLLEAEASFARAPRVATATPATAVLWRPSLEGALREARESNRPLFVTMRCLPCRQCADFDAAVLEGGPDLDPLLRRFVTVRLTDAAAIDLRIFPVEGFQDLDLSWWGWFLAPDARVVSVFGGRDEASDETRISTPALARTMERVLAHLHAGAGGVTPPLDGGSPRTPLDLPGFASWRARTPEPPGNCLHCHQVAEVLRQPAIDAGSFDFDRDLAVWPLPENVGLSVDRDDGLRVTAVKPESAAASAGLRPGDELLVAGDRRLFSQTDLRGVWHRAAADAALDLVWRRSGELMSGVLRLEGGGWKKTVLDWRMSVSQGNVGGDPTFWPNRAPEARRRALGLTENAMAIAPWFGERPAGPAYAAGLRPDDVIVEVEGESPPKWGRSFLVWFRRTHRPGDAARLTVVGPDGTRRDVGYRLSGG